MKFLRVGEFGKETPAILDNENKIRDLSKIIQDFNPENFKRPIKLSYNLIDSKNDKKILSKGDKLNFVIAKKLQEKGLKTILISNDQIIGKYIANDIKDKNGDLLIGAGFDITEDVLEKIIINNEKSLDIVNIDPINKGPYLLETLKIDKNQNKQTHLTIFTKF